MKEQGGLQECFRSDQRYFACFCATIRSELHKQTESEEYGVGSLQPCCPDTQDMFDDQEQEGKEAKDAEDDREEDQNQQDRIGPLGPTRV